jgi:kumamolisin
MRTPRDEEGHLMPTDFVTLPGSEKARVPQVETTGESDRTEPVTLTLVLRRRAAIPDSLVIGPETVSVDELGARYGAHPDDVDLVTASVARHGLQVAEVHAGSRRLKVIGPLGTAAAVFGASLQDARLGGVTFRHREGSLRVPAELDGVVVAVLGLDTRPVAHAQSRQASAQASSYTPPQVASAYGFPSGTTGSGNTIAIVELGGGFEQSDLNTYFSGLGVTGPTVTAEGVDGAKNVPGQDPSGADGEVLLDIEVAGSVAPGSPQYVYFAPNTDQGFIDAVSAAAHGSPTPIAISISWGGPEDSWSAQSRQGLDAALQDAAALGVTVMAASGDSGSSDGQSDGQPHCDYPASSPYALGCGGTRLEFDTSSGTITSESVWNDGSSGGAGGGGVSDVYPVPSWQAGAGVPDKQSGGPGRGVPDVAGNADPETGYQVRVDGQNTVIGGTSAVAPLWAALIARLAQATGKRFGLLQPSIYAAAKPGQATTGLRDITTGNNGGYSAAAGWDPCTGLGSPDGQALVTLLG